MGKTKAYLHSLSAPPGVSASGRDRLLHREIPGWGAQQCTGCLADVVLLLLVDELVVDTPWVRGTPDVAASFQDPAELVAGLAARGAATLTDAGDLVHQSAELISEFVGKALKSFEPWLTAQHEGDREWAAQEALMGQLWDALRGPEDPWREHMRAVGLSTVKHNYRNQNQAIMALLALLQWEDSTSMDSSLIREAIGRELLYVFTSVAAAGRAGAIAHDWSDHEPLYLLLAGENAWPLLSLRLPGLVARGEDDLLELFTGTQLTAARQLVAQALAGQDVPAATIERELLRVVPREWRAPHAYRQVAFYAYEPGFAARIGLPVGGAFAISKWRVAGLGPQG